MEAGRHNLVFMGVSGCGKSTVAALHARATGATLIEADDFHPPANVAKMRSGIPLTDADRAGWLSAMAGRIAEGRARGEAMAITCSALKRSYRDRLRAADPDLIFIHLTGSRELLAARIVARKGHFMPPGLLDSQLAALEPPVAPDERCVTVDIGPGPGVIQAAVTKALAEL
ncbi:MAG: gluconokinase [Verrucomicrobiota bacterium]